ncbi:MAG TPA: DipZ protein [Solirubrobacteraceae bacterium]|nr:DipZ protein [Solirubrobacteraceae bacterium]
MRAPIDTLSAPMIPPGLEWINVASLRMDKQLGHPVLIEFWDFCRCNSLRTLHYVRAWHQRYAQDGLRIISVHAGGYPPSRDPARVRAAVARLGMKHPVVIDADFELWREYGNEGWPARYLFGPELRLHSYHYGEGAYGETEAEIGELLGIEVEPLEPLRPEDAPGAQLVVPTAEQEGAWSGRYDAGAVWAVLEPHEGAPRSVRVDGGEIAVPHAGCFMLAEHPRHTGAVLDLEVGDGVTCHAVQFTAGLAS